MALPLLLLALAATFASTSWPQAGANQPSGVVMPKLLADDAVILSTSRSPSPCAAGCTAYGNCNAELGVCECPFGLSGPNCTDHALPACRTTNKPGVPVFAGLKVPKACECYRQLQRLSCLPNHHCDHHSARAWASVKCFARTGVPDAQQTSELPGPNDEAVKWYSGAVAADGARSMVEMVMPPPPAIAPHSRCPDSCNHVGWCTIDPANLNTVRCQCHAGYSGERCESKLPGECPLGCSGRGTCEAGFCKCNAPYWGVGCSRSNAYKLQPASNGTGVRPMPNWRQLRIYVYDLPATVAAPMEHDDGDAHVAPLHQAEMHFLSALLADNATWTEDPYDANLFFIPTFTAHAIGNHGDPTPRLLRAVDYARSALPFFNMSGGADHVVLLPAERGACWVEPLPELEPLIKLVHFGLSARNVTHMGPSTLMRNLEYGCFKDLRDVVIPPSFTPHLTVIQQAYSWQLMGGAPPAKDLLFFFVGDVKHDTPEYSGGVRQAIARILANHTYPDVYFQASAMRLNVREYGSLIARAKFCMAPYGHGFGMRLTHAVMHACIPVIIQDRVRQPFEDVLHYPDFTIRVAMHELPRLVHILRAVPDSDLLRMQRALAGVHRAFIWQRELGGQAYSYTLASLRKRLMMLRGNLVVAPAPDTIRSRQHAPQAGR